MIQQALLTKLESVRESLREMKSVAVAFSAGADSTFVLRVAVDVLGRENVLAVTGRSASVPEAELQEAADLAELIGARHIFVDTDEFQKEEYTSNPTNRCYHCKTTLYLHMENAIAAKGFARIVNGTNVDDLGDYRPGLQAATEHVVASPVADAGITKSELRDLSLHLGLPTFDKPASPCLSSRVPYGQEVTREKLLVIDQGERFLKDKFGLRECRVRHHGDFVRIEVPLADMEAVSNVECRSAIGAFFAAVGIESVEIDPKGFRSGSLNEVIAFGKRQ